MSDPLYPPEDFGEAFDAADPAAARLLLVEPWAHGDAGTGGRRLAPDGEREPPLPTLAPELVEFVLLPYVGHTRARVWARLRVDFDPPAWRAVRRRTSSTGSSSPRSSIAIPV